MKLAILGLIVFLSTLASATPMSVSAENISYKVLSLEASDQSEITPQDLKMLEEFQAKMNEIGAILKSQGLRFQSDTILVVGNTVMKEWFYRDAIGVAYGVNSVDLVNLVVMRTLTADQIIEKFRSVGYVQAVN